MNSSSLVALLASLCLATFSLHAQQRKVIDVRGIYIGMTEEQLTSLHGPSPLRDFSVAGISSVKDKTHVYFHDGRVDAIGFYFASDDFPEMRKAFREKYPKAQCIHSRATNLFGAQLQQVRCRVSDQDSILTLTRYGLDAVTSSLTMSSTRLEKQLNQQAQQKRREF